MHLPKILAISGSTKPNSSNERILKYIADRYKDELSLKIYDGIDKLPHFIPGIADEFLPETVVNLQNQIRLADALLFCTPEYVFSLPGSLKNAIEWNVSTTLLSKKPTGIIVAAASGEKALESLIHILTTLECDIPSESKVLIQGIKGKVDEQKGIIDQKAIADIDALVKGLLITISGKLK
jgi:NAD(P)H-dependent FMN reductase